MFSQDPNLNPMFGFSKLVRTYNGMGIKRIKVKGFMDGMIETCPNCKQEGLVFQRL